VVLEEMEDRVDRMADCMRIRGSTVEHPFGTIKSWLGPTHFQMKTLKHVSTEMSLHVLAYNLKRMIQMIGVVPLMEAMRA
jgi:transposase